MRAYARHVATAALAALAAALLGHFLLVRPARRELKLAQEALLHAEHEELTAQTKLEADQLKVGRLRRQIKAIRETEERMRVAEVTYTERLQHFKARRRRDFVLPGAKGHRPDLPDPPPPPREEKT